MPIKIKCEIVKVYPEHSGVDVRFHTDAVDHLQPVHINIPPGLAPADQHQYIMAHAPAATWFRHEALRKSGVVADLSALKVGHVIESDVPLPSDVKTDGGDEVVAKFLGERLSP